MKGFCTLVFRERFFFSFYFVGSAVQVPFRTNYFENVSRSLAHVPTNEAWTDNPFFWNLVLQTVSMGITVLLFVMFGQNEEITCFFVSQEDSSVPQVGIFSNLGSPVRAYSITKFSANCDPRRTWPSWLMYDPSVAL